MSFNSYRKLELQYWKDFQNQKYLDAAFTEFRDNGVRPDAGMSFRDGPDYDDDRGLKTCATSTS